MEIEDGLTQQASFTFPLFPEKREFTLPRSDLLLVLSLPYI
jgi:hypothetical protein